MTTAAPSTALATIQPAFTDAERLALAGFLAGYRGLTRDAYALDLRQFTSWCRARSLPLFAVRRGDIEGFARDLEARGRARATVTRRLSTTAGFYKYAVEEEFLDHSPAAHVRRPRVDYESHATALDRNELGALLVAAGLGLPLEHALISLLALNGLRVSEAAGADIEHLGLERGHRTLTITRKGGKVVTIPLAPRSARAIDLATGERCDGPIFLAADGRRLDRHGAARIVRKVARRAGIAKTVTPHTLRHAFITAALDAGVPLRDVQEAASHADPRTTIRYDRARGQPRPARDLHSGCVYRGRRQVIRTGRQRFRLAATAARRTTRGPDDNGPAKRLPAMRLASPRRRRWRPLTTAHPLRVSPMAAASSPHPTRRARSQCPVIKVNWVNCPVCLSALGQEYGSPGSCLVVSGEWRAAAAARPGNGRADHAHVERGCRMRALKFTEYGGPEVLTWGEAPVPHPGSGQIRIAVRAASVNPADWKQLSGVMAGGQPLAGTGYLGYDAAGVVDEVGEGVTGVSAGDEVFGRGRDTQAEYAVLDSWAGKPPAIDWAVAAAAGVAGETSERGLRLLGVKPGDTLFVDGGAGGVGAVAVQMALARGARVIASAGEANQDYVREIGAIPVLYGEGVADRVRAAAGGRVDAVFDVAGKTPVQDLTGLVSEPSQVLSIANFAAGQAGAQVTGGGADSKPIEALAEVADLLVRNKLVIKVQTFPFDRAIEAYRISQGGHVRGKLVLIP